MRLILGLALLPTAVISIIVALEALWGISFQHLARPFLWGVLSYPILKFLCLELPFLSFINSIFRRLYVFGHEATHVLTAWMTGAKVHDFYSGGESGHVVSSRKKTFFSGIFSLMEYLSPYCFPLFTVLVVAGFRVFSWFKPHASIEHIFMSAVGFSLSFHWIETWKSLTSVKQPDLENAGGIIFSGSLILLSNGILLLALIKLLFPHNFLITQSMWRIKGLSVRAWSRMYWWLKRDGIWLRTLWIKGRVQAVRFLKQNRALRA